jgi:Protein of unknown function (DUF1580)
MTTVEQILDEGAVGFKVIAKELLPGKRTNAHIHPVTMARWALHGVRLLDGTRLYLQVIRCGSRFLTSRAAVIRFLDAQTRACQSGRVPTAGGRNQAEAAAAVAAAGDRVRQMARGAGRGAGASTNGIAQPTKKRQREKVTA